MLLYSYTKSFYFPSGHVTVVCFSDNYPDGDNHTSVLLACYNYFLTFVTYLLPLTVLSVAYTRIGFVLWGSQQIGENRHMENIRAKRKVVKMMMVVVIIFLICWLPYQLYFTIFLKVLSNHEDIYTPIHLYVNIYWLAMSSTIVNPFVYCYMNKRFRIGFKYALRWCPCISFDPLEYISVNKPKKSIDYSHWHHRSNASSKSRCSTRYVNGSKQAGNRSSERRLLTPDPAESPMDKTEDQKLPIKITSPRMSVSASPSLDAHKKRTDVELIMNKSALKMFNSLDTRV